MAASVGGVLEEGFALIGKNYIKFLLLYLFIILIFVVIIFAALLLIVILGLLTAAATGALTALVVFFVVVLVGVVLLIEPLWLGAYYSMALQGLKGEISIAYAIKQAVQRYIPLLWTIALEALIVIVIDALIFSPLILPALGLLHSLPASGTTSMASIEALLKNSLVLIGIAIILVLVYLLVSAILAPILYEAVPLVMLENVSGVKAIKESISIGRSQFWNLLLIIIAITMIYFGLGFVAGILGDFLIFLNQIAGSILYIVIAVLLSAFMAAWVNALPIIFYKDYMERSKVPPRAAS
jgi:hypothetical protein